jgi:hypothetical protein
MATSLNRLTEQVRRLYARSVGSREDLKPLVEEREVKLLVLQATHELLSLETRESVKLGDINIPTCMIATYPAVAVTGSTGAQSSVLPAYPIKLPQDMGVWSVSSSAGVAYIPITTAAWDLLGGLDEGLLEDSIGFYVEGRTIKYTQDPTSTVTIKLLVVDPANIGDNEPYPIPPEMEGSVIERVLQQLMGSTSQPEKIKG